MEPLKSSLSQFLEEEEVEAFPEDHFDSEDDFYDSEFGSVIQHDGPIEDARREVDESPLRPYNHNLTTITEESVNQVANDIANLSFKPAKNFLNVFDEDQRRVEWENYLHPDNISDSMYKKQYSWEPSVLSSPPIIETRARLDDLPKSILDSSTNQSLFNKKVDPEATIVEPSSSKSNATEVHTESPVTSTRIPIRRPNLLMNYPLSSSNFQTSSKLNRSISQIGQDELNLPQVVESSKFDGVKRIEEVDLATPESQSTNKEDNVLTRTPKRSPDFNATIISATGHAISTPKDSRDTASNELSMLCRSISTIGDASPKRRAKSLKFHDTRQERSMIKLLNSRHKEDVFKLPYDSLSSTAIDRALNDPEGHTILSDATEVQQNLLAKIFNQASGRKEQISNLKLINLEELKKQNEKMMERSVLRSKYRNKFATSSHRMHSRLTNSRVAMPTIPESLSSTAIDRALNDPTNPTFVSNVTEAEIKLAKRINAYSKNHQRVLPIGSNGGGLEDLKRNMKKQLDRSKFKKFLKS